MKDMKEWTKEEIKLYHEIVLDVSYMDLHVGYLNTVHANDEQHINNLRSLLVIEKNEFKREVITDLINRREYDSKIRMEYLPTYLNEYANKYKDTHNDTIAHSITNSFGKENYVYTSLPQVLTLAAEEIERLREKIKEFETFEVVAKIFNKK